MKGAIQQDHVRATSREGKEFHVRLDPLDSEPEPPLLTERGQAVHGIEVDVEGRDRITALGQALGRPAAARADVDDRLGLGSLP